MPRLSNAVGAQLPADRCGEEQSDGRRPQLIDMWAGDGERPPVHEPSANRSTTNSRRAGLHPNQALDRVNPANPCCILW